MILRDAIHGLVAFEAPEEEIVVRLMDTPEVQRLRRIKQLGVTNLAFPGAEHTRFAHAVGCAYVMKMLLARLRGIHEQLPFWQRITTEKARDALAAAILHDCGHGPLSHLFEDSIPGTPPHEEWTEKIVLDPSTGVHKVLAAEDPGMPQRVASLVHGDDPLPYLAKAVSGTFDVDRCDYLLRDAHATGVRYGVFDLEWLLRSLRFAPVAGENQAPELAVDGAKGLPAIEGFLVARLFMFQQVYLHKATRSAEWMIRAILGRAAKCVAAGMRLPQAPRALEIGANGQPIGLADYLELDDAVLGTAIHAWESAKDSGLADLSKRIRVRALFKTLELFGEQATETGRERVLAVAQDIAKRHGLDPEVHVGLDLATTVPFSADPEPLVVFHKGPARRLGDVSFLLSRLKGQELSRVRLVMAPELREEITQAVSAL